MKKQYFLTKYLREQKKMLTFAAFRGMRGLTKAPHSCFNSTTND